MKRFLWLSLFLVGCQSGAPAPGPTSTPSPQAVTVIHPDLGTVDRVVELPADVRAGREAKIYAKIAGRLKELRVNIGDRVRAGQVLAVLDSPEVAREAESARLQIAKARSDVAASQAQVLYQARQAASARDLVSTARFQVQQAEAELSQARAERDLRDLSYRRLKAVYAQDEGLIAHQELDQAYAVLKVASGRVVSGQRAEAGARARVRALISSRAAATQQVSVAQAQSESALAQAGVTREEALKAQDWLDYTVIRAPFAGIITHRYLFPGDLVQSSAQSSQGATSPIVGLADESFVTVSVRVPELDAPFVHRGSRLELVVEALPGHRYTARVSRVAQSLDVETDRAMPIEADIPNPLHRWNPGMFAKARLVLESHAAVLSLPTSAVLNEKGKTSVFVLTGSDRVAKKAVQVGLANDRRTEIKGGISIGDRVAVPTGKESLSDGALVQVKQ